VINEHDHVDKPEPRWQALLAFLAVGAIYLALPRSLIVGPIWLLPTLIVVLLVPTVVSHRTGRRSLNRVLGIIINGITTFALIGSVILLVRALPSHTESPLQLLLSGALLWLTNVIVFALWYWRLDGGGPTIRQELKEFGSTSFLFPQMQVPHDERAQFECTRWRPRFIDYLFVAFTQSSIFGPTDAPLLARWVKNSRDDPNFYFAQYRDSSDLARSWRALVYLPIRMRTPAASARMPITIAGMTMLGTSAIRPARMR
jgi:hypothetical protein